MAYNVFLHFVHCQYFKPIHDIHIYIYPTYFYSKENLFETSVNLISPTVLISQTSS